MQCMSEYVGMSEAVASQAYTILPSVCTANVPNAWSIAVF